MCGRYISTSSLTDLAEIFQVEEVRADPEPPRYNVAPTLPVYAVATTSAGRRALGTFKWGLVPSFAAKPSFGSRFINARAETITVRPAYRAAVARRRCLIPADAFYEWQRRTGADGRPAGKLPYAIRRQDGRPMAFAGVWEVWRDKGDPESPLLRTCAIVTTSANDLISPIHNRMPLVLAEKDWSVWLDRHAELSVAEQLMVPAPSEWFEVFPVSSLVNSVTNDGPELVRPLPAPTA
jgi:putative SOS response-associated peptidase YedK